MSSENLKAEYQEVGSNFRLLTDIRFKLLGFLPIGTGAGVALAEGWSEPPQAVLIGLFGLVVTCAIAFYSKRNDQLYNALVARAADLERHLGLKDGAYAQRPRSWLRIGRHEINHGKIWWIYGASLAAWLFILLHGALRLLAPHLGIPVAPMPGQAADAPLPVGPIAVVAAIAIVVLAMLLVVKMERDQQKALRAAARRAVEILETIPLSRPPDLSYWRPFLAQTRILAGKADTKENRAKLEKALLAYLDDTDCFYWDRPTDRACCEPRAAAQLTGLLSDMPSRWIQDIASGRRG